MHFVMGLQCKLGLGDLGNKVILHGNLGEKLTTKASDVRAIGYRDGAIALVLWAKDTGLNVIEP
jgi:hypothetical protein